MCSIPQRKKQKCTQMLRIISEHRWWNVKYTLKSWLYTFDHDIKKPDNNFILVIMYKHIRIHALFLDRCIFIYTLKRNWNWPNSFTCTCTARNIVRIFITELSLERNSNTYYRRNDGWGIFTKSRQRKRNIKGHTQWRIHGKPESFL